MVKFSKISIWSLSFFLLIVVSLTFGQSDSSQGNGPLSNVFQKTQTILVNIIQFLLSILLILSSMILIYLGIKYIVSKGKIEELHKSLIYVILGIVLLVTAVFIPNLIRDFIESNIT